MTNASLTEALTKHLGAKKDGAAYLVPADTKLTMFVDLEGETLAVQSVTRVELTDSLVVVDTQKGERFAFASEDVRVVKADRGDGARRDRGAGFGK